MSRRELLELFCQSETPRDDELLLENWKGGLLKNNDVVTLVSDVLTHYCFGRGFG
jgi:hypothetical protein